MTIPESSSTLSYGIVDYKLVKTTLLQFLYDPYPHDLTSSSGARSPRNLAIALRAVEQGDGAPMWKVNEANWERFTCECPLPGKPQPPQFATPDASGVLVCVDAGPLNINLVDVSRYFDANGADLEFADVGPIRALCS